MGISDAANDQNTTANQLGAILSSFAKYWVTKKLSRLSKTSQLKNSKIFFNLLLQFKYTLPRNLSHIADKSSLKSSTLN